MYATSRDCGHVDVCHITRLRSGRFMPHHAIWNPRVEEYMKWVMSYKRTSSYLKPPFSIGIGLNWLVKHYRYLNLLPSTRVVFFSGLDYYPPDIQKVIYFSQLISCFVRPDIKISKENPLLLSAQQYSKGKVARSRDGSSGKNFNQIKDIYTGQGDLAEIGVTHIEYPTSIPVVMWRFPHDRHPVPNTGKISLDGSPPSRVQPALPTVTWGEEGF